MGAANAKAAYGRWRHLPHLPFRLLTWMALRSMDADEPPLYWAGWEELAVASGRTIPDADHRPPMAAGCEVCTERRAALKAVTKTVKVLLDQGAIRVHAKAAPDRNTYYALQLGLRSVPPEGEPSPVDNGAGTVPSQGEPSSISRPVNGSPSAGSTVHPQRLNGAPSAERSVPPEGAPEEYGGVGGLQGGGELDAVGTSGSVEREAGPVDNHPVTEAGIVASVLALREPSDLWSDELVRRMIDKARSPAGGGRSLERIASAFVRFAADPDTRVHQFTYPGPWWSAAADQLPAEAKPA